MLTEFLCMLSQQQNDDEKHTTATKEDEEKYMRLYKEGKRIERAERWKFIKRIFTTDFF